MKTKTAGAISSVFHVEGAQKQTFPEPPNTGGRGMSSLIQLKKRRRPTLPLVRSTIGADGLNFSVRNGKRWNPDAMTA